MYTQMSFRRKWLNWPLYRFISLLLYIIRHWKVIAIIVLWLAVIGIILGATIFQWEWTGLAGSYNKNVATTINLSSKESTTTTMIYVPPKTMWDWMNFIIAGLVTIVAVFLTNLFGERQKKTELDIASEKQREDALQSYIDKISELLLHENLLKPKPESEVRNIARVRTLTALPRLDGTRKSTIVKFLYDSGLITTSPPIIDLHGADLRETNLVEADLHGIKLQGANLVGADLRKANLSNADLNGAILGRIIKVDFDNFIMPAANMYQAVL